jgi:histidinol-phosphate aminotransferase
VLDRRSFGQAVIGSAVGALAVGRGRTASAAGAPIRIGSNENPFGAPPSVLAAIGQASGEAHRYPGPGIGKLSSQLSERLGVPASQVVLACGSGDILRAAVVVFTSASAGLVSAAPTFEAPARQAQALGTPVVAVPVTADLSLDLPAMAAAAKGAGLVFVCNPNNPTGTIVPTAKVAELVERVARESPTTTVLVDEAYFEYADHPDYTTTIPLVARFPNVVVSRTFSKIYGMAGLRVGYAVAAPDTAARFRRWLSPGSLSGVSVAAAVAALSEADRPALERTRNRETRMAMATRFEKAGYRVAPSEANFVLVDVRRDVAGFQAACRQRDVHIARPFPPLTTWARVTVGTPDEMDRAMPVLLDVLAKPDATSARAEIHPLDAVWSC